MFGVEKIFFLFLFFVFREILDSIFVKVMLSLHGRRCRNFVWQQEFFKTFAGKIQNG